MISPLLENILKLYGFIILGFLIGVIFSSKQKEIAKIGSSIVVNIFTPIILFLTIVGTQFFLDFISIVKIICLELISVFFAWSTTYLFLKNRVESRKKLGSYFFLNGFPNVMIYGAPIVLAFFEEKLLIILVIFSSSALFLRATIGMYIGEKMGANLTLSLKDSIKKLLLFPPLLGIVAGIIGMNFDWNKNLLLNIKSFLNPFYSSIGAILIGFILASLKRGDFRKYLKDIGIVALWRFGFSFLIYLLCIFFLQFMEFQTEIRTLLLVIIIGPPAVMNVTFAVYFDLDEKFAAISVATVTLIALMILPLIILFGTNFL
ncbi:MAG: AEC family transporter [Promethearchaeota archaeon]